MVWEEKHFISATRYIVHCTAHLPFLLGSWKLNKNLITFPPILFVFVCLPKRSRRFRLKAVVDTNKVIFCCFMLTMSFCRVSICFLRSSCWSSRVLNQLSVSVVVNLNNKTKYIRLLWRFIQYEACSELWKLLLDLSPKDEHWELSSRQILSNATNEQTDADLQS